MRSIKISRPQVQGTNVLYPMQRSQSFKQSESMKYPVMAGASMQEIQDFNKDNAVYTQGYRIILAQGSNAQTPVLAASGTFFYGIAITIGTFVTLSDTYVDFAINGRNLLVQAPALMMIPNYAQGMLYFPLPQPLTGKDTFKINFNKVDAGAATMAYSFVYKPAL